jgi:hypothetical protein
LENFNWRGVGEVLMGGVVFLSWNWAGEILEMGSSGWNIDWLILKKGLRPSFNPVVRVL